MKVMHMYIEKEVAHVYHVIRHPSLMTGHRRAQCCAPAIHL